MVNYLNSMKSIYYYVNYKLKQELKADFIKCSDFCSVHELFADLKITFETTEKYYHKVSAQLTQWYTLLSCRASH